MIEINKVYNEECLQGMQNIYNESIDMILCDLPYGTTKCRWDSIIPFEKLWEQYKRIIKKNGAIVLTGSQPFTSKLICSNLDMFKYEMIWEKPNPSNPMLAKKQTLKNHENISIFYKSQCTFNPQMELRLEKDKRKGDTKDFGTYKHINQKRIVSSTDKEYKYPLSVKKFNREQTGFHPTQKPVSLFEYLIKTYTNENDLVLDNCMGSGTTAIAAMNTKRNFIGFELDKEYYNISVDRIKKNKNLLCQ